MIAMAATYLEKKIAGVCTWSGCTRTPSDGAQLCAKHKKQKAKQNRERRNRRRNKGLCAYCHRKSTTRRCLVCKARRAAARTRAKALGVRRDAREEGISSRMWKDAGNRTRYHGQETCGRQSNEQLDEQDASYAVEAIAKGMKALAVARAPEHASAPKADRVAAVRAALSQLDHGGRFLEEILTRNKYSANIIDMVPGKNRRRR